MKKIFASLAALMMSAVVTTASAQAVMYDDSFPWRIGIQLGFNAPTFSESQYSATIGWNMGATVLYDTQNFIPDSYLRGSVLYTRKGTAAGLDILQDVHSKDYEFKDLTSYLHYLEVPVHFGYAYEIDDLFCVLAETGPYLGMRFTGSLRTDDTKVTENGVVNTELSGPTNGDMKDYYRKLRRFDVGWGVRAGVMIDKKYELTLSYDWGLCEAIPHISGGNRNFAINATVYFD